MVEMTRKNYNKILNFLFPFSWLLCLALCLMILSFTTYAEEPVFENKLPFQYQLTATYNAQWNETIFSYFENSNLPINDEDYVLVYRDWSSYGFDGNYYNCIYYFYLVPIGNFSSVQNYNSFDFSTIPIGYTTVPNKPLYNVSVIVAYYRSGNTDQIYTGRIYSTSTTMPSNFQQTLFGHEPTTTTINNGYSFTSTSMTPVYFTRRFYSQSQQLILANGSGNDIESSAIAPDFEHYLPIGNGVTTPDSIPPQITINNYSWTTYNSPTIDTSTVETLLQSLINVINYLAGWLASNLSGEFSNFIDNIEALINYVVETLQYYLGLIIDNIQNGIQNLYDNIVAVFEPFIQKVNELVEFFTEPWSQEEFETTLENSDFYGAIYTIHTNTQTFYNAMASVEEPDHFTFHYSTGFHPDNEPGGISIPTIEGEISFDWLYPLRNVYRPVLWVICIYQMFEYGVSSLSGALLGHNSRS